MIALIGLGMVVQALSVQDEMVEAIAKRNLPYPGEFREWIGHALPKPKTQNVLVLPGNTKVDGDLVLDWTDALRDKKVAAIFVRGDLEVTGGVVSPNSDGGPLLLVAGNLKAKHLDKQGAPMVVLGNVELQEYALCEYNHGVLRIGGDLKAKALIVVDHDVLVCGKSPKMRADGEDFDFREVLVEDVFDLESDPDASWPEVERIRERLKKGLPILKGAK